MRAKVLSNIYISAKIITNTPKNNEPINLPNFLIIFIFFYLSFYGLIIALFYCPVNRNFRPDEKIFFVRIDELLTAVPQEKMLSIENELKAFLI